MLVFVMVHDGLTMLKSCEFLLFHELMHSNLAAYQSWPLGAQPYEATAGRAPRWDTKTLGMLGKQHQTRIGVVQGALPVA